MSNVFVIDTDQQPLPPVHPGRARLLLKAGKAAVYRRFSFTLILKDKVEQPMPAPLRLKIDPGAKTTGLALVDDATGDVLWAAELTHRGAEIKKALDTRRGVRRGRRSRQTRYRTNHLGFPTGHCKRRKRYFGYQTGDLVWAVVPEGLKCAGTHVGRVTVKAAGTFTIATKHGKVTDVPHRYCRPLLRSDGYAYHQGARISPPSLSPKGASVPAPAQKAEVPAGGYSWN